MKELVLINLPSPFLQSPTSIMPLGLLYVAAVAEREGVDVSICDLAYGIDSEPIPEARFYGMSVTTPLWPVAVRTMALCYGSNPDASVILGGPHMTANPHVILCHGVAVVAGPADKGIASMLYEAEDRDLFTRVYELPHETDLDKLPFPAWHLLNMRNYGQNMRGYWTATIHGARGCPYDCIFCSKDVFGKKYRRRSTGSILAEAEILKNKYEYRAIHFLDDALIMNERDLVELCLGMRELGMMWKCLLRTDLVNKSMLALMAECGCLEIAYGIESGSQEILDIVGKNNTVEKNTNAVKWTEAAGIRAKAFLIAGLPGESRETMSETAAWFAKAMPSNYCLSALRPFKGSPIGDNPEKYGLKIIDKDPESYSYKGKGEIVAVADTEYMKAAEITEEANRLDKHLSALCAARRQ